MELGGVGDFDDTGAVEDFLGNHTLNQPLNMEEQCICMQADHSSKLVDVGLESAASGHLYRASGVLEHDHFAVRGLVDVLFGFEDYIVWLFGGLPQHLKL